MITTATVIKENLTEYASPANKIASMVDKGQYIPIIRGLYATNRNIPGYLLAGSIYGPSYLSFEYALSQHNLIPEAVYVFTSATYEKKKKKRFSTPFGNFTYRDVPSKAYPLYIELVIEGNYSYQIATPEKALCDVLYAKSPVANQKEMFDLLFSDMRIDAEEFDKLDVSKIEVLKEKYKSNNIKRLFALMQKMKRGAL